MIITTAARVAWLLARHARGCYRWREDGRCIDCGQRGKGRASDQEITREMRAHLAAGVSMDEAIDVSAERLKVDTLRVALVTFCRIIPADIQPAERCPECTGTTREHIIGCPQLDIPR